MSSSIPLVSAVHCRNYDHEHCSIKVSGDLIQVFWDETISRQVNTAMEDLWVQIFRPGEDLPVFEKKCTDLHSTEFYLAQSGKFDFRLVVKEHSKLYMATDCHYTPKVNLVSENELRHHLTWADIDWERVKNQVERAARVDWNKEIDLFVHCLRKPDNPLDLPEEEWIRVGPGDYTVIMGSLLKVNLAVVKKDVEDDTGRLQANLKDPTVLKIIFSIAFDDPDTISRLFNTRIEIPADAPYFELKREVWEEDSVQLRAWWKIPQADWDRMDQEILKPLACSWDDTQLEIELLECGPRGKEPVQGKGGIILPGASDWLFTNLKDGRAYQAVIYLNIPSKKRRMELMYSTLSFVPVKPDQIVLIPIDEVRAYTYWHLDRDRLAQRLLELSDRTGQEVKTYIKIYEEWAGQLFHQMHKDVEVHLEFTDNWYLNLEPDKVYRVQLIAASGTEVMDLTDV